MRSTSSGGTIVVTEENGEQSFLYKSWPYFCQLGTDVVDRFSKQRDTEEDIITIYILTLRWCIFHAFHAAYVR